MRVYVAKPEVVGGSLSDVAGSLKLPVRRGNLPHLLIGRKEWVTLPELGVSPIHAKIDSGARSSCLHVEMIEEFSKSGVPWVRFVAENFFGEPVECELPVEGTRHVKSSSGDGGHRIFVETVAEIGDGFRWPVVMSLTDRSEMKHAMLLGRRALAGYFLIDCHRSHLFGRVDMDQD